MRVLKGIVFLCFITTIIFILLAYSQLPEIKGYELEISDAYPYYSGWTPLDVMTSSFYYMLKSPTITSALLIFMYYVGVGVVSYLGLISGLIVVIIERGKRADFLFTLSFISCLFFAIFITVIAILL